ncbi:hypothetical protein JTE90_020493 [Oedothorax gibbosus]|uniref:Cytochrome oxidase complex assembly protein 1 n=1 Tax=Oedothorax gibbosus TaxID=931172 RepID=A0AAV6UT95_9ARAC|nr:hypothetical protein JTE90_020493 [Oedothorax gibbosus]
MWIPKTRNRIMVGLSIASGIGTVGVFYIRLRVERAIGNQALCKNSIQDLLQHKQSLAILGEPVTWYNPNLKDSYNRITETNANLAVPVKGPKNKGNLLIDAFRKDGNSDWSLTSLKLKVSEEETVIREKSA